MDKALIGLGNPGKKYQETRHNIGRNFLDHFAKLNDLKYSKKFLGQYACIKIGEDKVHLLLPDTFMNLSGDAAIELTNFFKIENNNLLVIHDEIDFDFGRISFKKGGGTAGHNGLKSLVNHLGDDFYRLRIGIGKNSNTVSWVLTSFTAAENKFIDKLHTKCHEILETFIVKGFDEVAQKFNNRNFTEDSWD